MKKLFALSCLAFLFSTALLHAQGTASGKKTIIRIEKNENGSQAVIEREQPGTDPVEIAKLLSSEELMKNLGSVAEDEEVEIIIRKKKKGQTSIENQLELERQIPPPPAVEPPMLGVYYEPAPVNGKFYVKSVIPGSPADKAGMVSGDEIVALNGKEFSESSDLRAEISRFRAGDKVTVWYERNGERQKTNVILTQRREEAFNQNFLNPLPPSLIRPTLGIMTRPESVGSQSAGIRVEEVIAGSMASEAGLQAGDILLKVDGNTLTRTEDVSKALSAKNEGESLQLTWLREGREMKGKATMHISSLNKLPENFETRIIRRLEEMNEVYLNTPPAPSVQISETRIRITVTLPTAEETEELGLGNSAEGLEAEVFTVSPNPASSRIAINLNTGKKGEVKLVVMDVSGKKILEKSFADGEAGIYAEFDMNSHPSGIYFVKAVQGESAFTRKVVVQH